MVNGRVKESSTEEEEIVSQRMSRIQLCEEKERDFQVGETVQGKENVKSMSGANV